MQIILENDNARTYFLTPNNQFHLPAATDELLKSESATDFENTSATLGELFGATEAVKADPYLSDIGKKKKLETQQAKVVQGIANAWAAVDAREAKVNAQEAYMLAVPHLEPTHTATAVEDREIRDWIRSQPLSEVAELLGPTGDDRLKIALLRSPIPQSDALVTLASESWTDNRRAANAAAFKEIEQERAGFEWSRKGLVNLGGMSRRVLGKDWDEQRILRTVLGSTNPVTTNGYGVFGLSENDARLMRDRIESEKSGQRWLNALKSTASAQSLTASKAQNG